MVGSDENKISAALDKVQSTQPEANLSINNAKQENGKVTINFTASGKTNNSDLNIALAEKKAITNIKAGENGGVTLTNYNVVRNFKARQQFKVGENAADIDIPAGLDPKNISVVLFLQKNDNNKIIAAAQAML
jgi:hypothetical protein